VLTFVSTGAAAPLQKQSIDLDSINIAPEAITGGIQEANSFLAAFDKAVERNKEFNHQIEQGRVFCFHSATMPSSLLGATSLSVTISYDKQPIGGVLSIRADLIPLYSGVGVSSRPIVTETYASAVDGFSKAQVRAVVGELVEKIDSQIPHQRLQADAGRSTLP
jgi:hypothetical protein